MNKKHSKFKSILVIDSGIGGLSTLAETIKLTCSNFVYFADNKHSPYGDKSDTFLKNRLCEIIRSESKLYNFSMVVIACNTATTSAIKFLRNTFPKLKIIGTEPAYKVAMDQNFKSPAILATPRTIFNIKNIVPNNFKLIANKNLATIIENLITSNSPINSFKLLKEIFKLKIDCYFNDCLILGCTHYVFIKEKLSKIMNIPIFDGNQGVSKQVYRNYQSKNSKISTIKITLSLKNSNSLQKYKKILKQILANQIKLC